MHLIKSTCAQVNNFIVLWPAILLNRYLSTMSSYHLIRQYIVLEAVVLLYSVLKNHFCFEVAIGFYQLQPLPCYQVKPHSLRHSRPYMLKILRNVVLQFKLRTSGRIFCLMITCYMQEYTSNSVAHCLTSYCRSLLIGIRRD